MSKNKRPNPYKEANEAFLREKAQEEGMHVLDNGVMYRVLEEGHGTKCPKPNGIVYVHYTGRLIDEPFSTRRKGSLCLHFSSYATSSWAGKSPSHVCMKAINGNLALSNCTPFPPRRLALWMPPVTSPDGFCDKEMVYRPRLSGESGYTPFE